MSEKTEKELDKEAQAKFAAQKKLEAEKPHKCPLCNYRAKQASLLSRHINYHHKEMAEKTAGHLLTALNSKKTVPEMLISVAKWMEKGTTFDEHLPEDVITYLKKEDAKVQLILRVIAIDKVQRALELGEKVKQLHTAFNQKLDSAEFKKDATASSYLSIIERIQSLQQQELNFLKEITLLGEINLNDVVDKLVDAFGSSKLGSMKTGSGMAFQLTGVQLPEEAGDREALRTILHQIFNKKEEKSIDGESSPVDIPVEAQEQTSPGTDNQTGPKDKLS